MKKIAFGFLGSLLVLVSLSGCNTVQGVGQDVQHGGKAIEDAAQ